MQSAEKFDRQAPYIISSPRQLRAMGSPMRHKILGVLDVLDIAPVSRIAEELDCPAESLYYHIHSLLKVGLIVRAGSQPAGKRPEALYRAVSDNIRIDQSKRTPGFIKAIKDIYRAALRAMERNLMRGLDNELHSKEGPRSLTELRQLTVQLDRDDIAELKARMADLEQFLQQRNLAAGGEVCSVMLAYASLGSTRTSED